jgi:hypothetical protein
MFSAGEPAPDAAPRKARPFLKRGEGVNKRLIAYKLRDEAAELRKQRASTSSSNTRQQPANSDHFSIEPGSNAGRQPGQQRRAWQQQSRHQPFAEQQEEHGAGEEDEVLVAPRRGPAAMHSGTSAAAAAAASEQSSWGAGQNVEVSAAALPGQLRPQQAAERHSALPACRSPRVQRVICTRDQSLDPLYCHVDPAAGPRTGGVQGA